MVQKDVENLSANNIGKTSSAIGIEVVFYTDPLCCWTWAMHPQWKRILAELGSRLPVAVKYKMGGLLPSWKHFSDKVNSIQKPIQMGPEWMHARVLSGVQINDRIWITDPPASSFPACIAVKCVELASPQMVPDFLYLLQETVMVKGLNIARTDMLLQCGAALKVRHPVFDLGKFKAALLGEEGRAAFRKDLQECKYLSIHRLPTILFKSSDGRSILLSGYQSYESLNNACSKLIT